MRSQEHRRPAAGSYLMFVITFVAGCTAPENADVKLSKSVQAIVSCNSAVSTYASSKGLLFGSASTCSSSGGSCDSQCNAGANGGQWAYSRNTASTLFYRIYWKSDTGAHGVKANVTGNRGIGDDAAWFYGDKGTGPEGGAALYEASSFGYPVTEWVQMPTTNAWYQYFEGGVMANHTWSTSLYARPLGLLNGSRMRGAHNAATNVGESLLSLIGYHHIQQIEIDLHADGPATTPGSVDWRVYHIKDNNGNPGGAHCTPLRKCLKLLRVFHDNNPTHEPIIVFLDSNDAAFGPNFPNPGSVWTPVELDIAIRSIGDDVLYKASDLLRKADGSSYPTVGHAARAGAWPKIADLRGKFIFGLTGNFVPKNDNSALSYYMINCGAYCGANVAFEVRDIGGGQTIPQVVSEMDGRGNAMFNFMADWSYNDTVAYAWVQGYMTRGYGDCLTGCGLNSGQYQNSYLSHMHMMALDDPNMSLIWNTGFYVADKGTASSPTGLGSESFAYTDTLAAGGKVIENTRVRSVEGDFITLVSQSASWDAGSTTDNIMFANQIVSGGMTNTWTAFISGRSAAGEDPNAKGCIMARASLSADAPFVAVCKRSNQTISALVRTATGGAVTSTNIARWDIGGCDANNGPSAVAMDTVSCLDLHFVELQAYNNNTCVKAFGSSTSMYGGDMTQIVDQCVSSALNYQGIVSASHNINGTGTFLFSGLKLNGVTQTLANLATLTKMGSINTNTSVAYDYIWNRESIGGDATPANPYFCGDTVCHGDETAVSCPADCRAVAPSGVSGNYSSGQANIAWAAVTAAVSYRVKRGTTSGGPYTQIANPATVSYGDPGVAGTNYYVVSSMNTAGLESTNSAEVAVSAPPAVPSYTGLSRIDGTSAVSVWGSSFGATSYNIKRGTTSGGPFTTIAAGVTGTYTDSTVSPATTYYYTVSAVNSIGETANAPQASVLTSSAPALTATNGVNLSFPAPPGATAGGWVERSTSSSGPFSWLASPSTNSYSDPVSCGTTYYYRVKASYGGSTYGPFSNTASATYGGCTCNYNGNIMCPGTYYDTWLSCTISPGEPGTINKYCTSTCALQNRCL